MSDTNFSYMEVSAKRKKRNQFISVLIIIAIVLMGVIVWGWIELQKSRNAERCGLGGGAALTVFWSQLTLLRNMSFVHVRKAARCAEGLQPCCLVRTLVFVHIAGAI